ncbi:MAG: hypothetical protein GX128_02645 [Bacteroidales bacterium]|nr:hypothetical protein [Bacteroidales bacterium]
MKTLRTFFVMLLLVALGSCSTSVKFPISKIVPAADGVAKINVDKNDNYQISLTVKHLAKPERLSPPKNQYVVWALTQEAENVNIGRLAISKSMSGSMKTSIPFKPVQLFITAEDYGNIVEPSNFELFRTDKF